MDFLAEARRRAFSVWLRTGRLPQWARAGSTECKYNPWHNPDDGRFTFAGTGRYFGRGSSSGAAKRSLDVRMGERPKEPFGGFAGDGDGFNGGGGGSSDGWTTHEEDAQRARNERRSARTDERPERTELPATTRSARRAIDNPKNWRRVEANGYTYLIDSLDRTREISGTIAYNPSQRRSRSAQARAGGIDRRPSDHGGHYVARELNGPPEGINLFAQDAKFNRRDYREMENQWRKAVRTNKNVKIKIVPRYPGSSGRPSVVNVWFWIDENLESLRFPNEPRRK